MRHHRYTDPSFSRPATVLLAAALMVAPGATSLFAQAPGAATDQTQPSGEIFSEGIDV